MLNDQNIIQAVARILQRSERQLDVQKLIDSFVDTGILPQLLNRNNQIIYGRRGTGKTHVFRVLAAKLREDPRNTVVEIDCRTLGSTEQFSDHTIPLRQRCLSLFRDLLEPLHSEILDHIAENPTDSTEQALDALGQFGRVVTEPLRTYAEKMVATQENKSSGSTAGLEARISMPPAINASVASKSETSSQTQRSFEVKVDDKIIFPELSVTLERVITFADTTLHILIDEWSSLPQDIQPYLAEFIKRSLLANPLVILKIASLEQRSRFSEVVAGQSIGFELGGDISTGTDIDDYYVYDRNPKYVADFFAEILYRHLLIELPIKYLETTFAIDSAPGFIRRMFTEQPTFNELVRASEGVVRDMINIFTTAFFDAKPKKRANIDRKTVTEAARSWFEKDKSQNLDRELLATLRAIVDSVIGGKKARSFLLRKELERHPTIQKLFDARVLHLMHRGYADKDNPGLRYNIYTLDYGTYVDLIGTVKQPELEFQEFNVENSEIVVPFDDKRSIRRIILDESKLI